MQPISRAARTIRPGFFARPFTSTSATPSRWTPGPAPPRLPQEEQEIFEKLQQQSTGAFSTPRSAEQAASAAATPASPSSSSSSSPSAESDAAAPPSAGAKSPEAERMLEMLRERARIAAKGDGEELHPNVRRGAAPEFEGDVNPKTGEVGGPKNDPLRWGVSGDWSYNGRVTDF